MDARFSFVQYLLHGITLKTANLREDLSSRTSQYFFFAENFAAMSLKEFPYQVLGSFERMTDNERKQKNMIHSISFFARK